MDTKQLSSLRHPMEQALYFICAAINTAVIAFLLTGLFIMPERIMLIPMAYNTYWAVATAFGVAFFSMGSTFAGTRVYSVRVDEDQFPQLYEIVREYARQLELKRVPLIYIKQEGGILNAFAAYFWGRNYVQLNTEIFETAFLEHRDMDAVAFIIAHEMAHIKLQHPRFWYNASVLLAKLVPLLGPALSRAQEYSCDRIALALCPQGKHGIFMLLLGKHLYKHVNVDRYLSQAEQTRGWFELAVNINASHPVHTRRVLALYRPDAPGRVLF